MTTYTELEGLVGRMKKALSESQLTLRASGGGISAETGNEFCEILLGGCVVLPRRLVEEVTELLDSLNLTTTKQ